MWDDAFIVSLIASAAAVVGALGTVALALIAWWQLSGIAAQTRLQGERERKWRTLEICSRMDTDPLLDETTRRIWDQSEGGKVYENMVPVRRDIINLLNYLDSVAVGIGQGFYVEEVARDHLEPVFEKAAKVFLSDSMRRQLELDRSDFGHLLGLVDSWTKRETKYRDGAR